MVGLCRSRFFAARELHRQRRNATIRPPPRQQLLNNTKQTLQLITKNARTIGGPLPPVGSPVTRRSNHPIVTPLSIENRIEYKMK